jgi:hypothetical protein
MDFGVIALIALNNMLLAFLTWVLPRGTRRGVGCGFGAFFGFPLVVHAEPSGCLLRLGVRGGVGYGCVYFASSWRTL